MKLRQGRRQADARRLSAAAIGEALDTSSSYLLVLPKTLYGANVNHDYGELSVSYPYFLYLFPSKEMDDLGVPCR